MKKENWRTYLDIIFFLIILTAIIYAQWRGVYERDNITIDCDNTIIGVNNENYQYLNKSIIDWQKEQGRKRDGTRIR